MLSSALLSTTLLLAYFSLTYADPCPALTYPCTEGDGIFILAARGTNNSYTGSPQSCAPNYEFLGDSVGGDLRNIAQAVINKAPGSKVYALPYAANGGQDLTARSYFASIGFGVTQAQRIIKGYVANCTTQARPVPRIMLLGYSQGGQVMVSTLIGDNTTLQGGGMYPSLKSLGLAKNIAGAVVIAPTSYTNSNGNTKFPINQGTATQSGLFPRVDYATFNNDYVNRARAYCNSGDFACGSGEYPKPFLPPAVDASVHNMAVAAFTSRASAFLTGLV